MQKALEPLERDRPEAYTRLNPPPSKEDAIVRLEELEEAQYSIFAQLTHKTDRDFESDDEYYDWRERAIIKLGYVNKELAFIAGWLRAREGPGLLNSGFASRESITQPLLELLCITMGQHLINAGIPLRAPEARALQILSGKLGVRA